MSADAKENPERLEIRAKPRPMTRLNRKAIGALCGAMGLAVLLSVMWGLKKDESEPKTDAVSQHHVERVARAEGISSLPRDYAGVSKPPPLGPPVGEFGRPIKEHEPGAGRLPGSADPQAAAQEREQKEAEEAAKAAVFFQLKGRGARSQTTVSETSKATEHRAGSDFLQELSSRESSSNAADPNKQQEKVAFAKAEVDSRIYANAALQTPRSPYQLMAGAVIPAALVTGIKSDLPGQIIATVTENVFDSVDGTALLIPQGTKLIGEYDSQVTYGQSRLLLVWNRLIMPNGTSIVLERMPGVDTQGYSGLRDGVDWHWRRILGGAALATLLGAGAELAAPDRSNAEGTVVVAARESVQETVNQVGQEMTRRNLDIQPTLTVRPGLPLRVIVNRDLILRPYGS